jgi:hypothetical protein
MEGKPVRGAPQQGALDVPRRSGLSQRLGLTLLPPAVADKTHEMGAIPAGLAALVLAGRGVTMDARWCPREGARTIGEKGGTPCWG